VKGAFALVLLAGLSANGIAYADEPAPDPARGRVELGPTYLRIYDIPVYGGAGFVGAGIDHPQWAWSLGVGAFFGRTQYGLGVGEARVGCVLELRVARLRFGAELRLEGLVIDRTTTNGSLLSLGSGLRPYVSGDLVQWDGGRALTLSSGFDVDFYGVLVWGPNVRVGVRY
jgi:hypothetical protein